MEHFSKPASVPALVLALGLTVAMGIMGVMYDDGQDGFHRGHEYSQATYLGNGNSNCIRGGISCAPTASVKW